MKKKIFIRNEKKICILNSDVSEPVTLNTSFSASPLGVKAFGTIISPIQSSITIRESEVMQPEEFKICTE